MHITGRYSLLLFYRGTQKAQIEEDNDQKKNHKPSSKKYLRKVKNEQHEFYINKTGGELRCSV